MTIDVLETQYLYLELGYINYMVWILTSGERTISGTSHSSVFEQLQELLVRYAATMLWVECAVLTSQCVVDNR